jgi:hypothetical protein
MRVSACQPKSELSTTSTTHLGVDRRAGVHELTQAVQLVPQVRDDGLRRVVVVVVVVVVV